MKSNLEKILMIVVLLAVILVMEGLFYSVNEFVESEKKFQEIKNEMDIETERFCKEYGKDMTWEEKVTNENYFKICLR